MAEKQTKEAASYEGQTDKITNTARIATILNNLKARRALLRVTMPGSGKQYNSAVLEIDNNAGIMVLDELNPREGHDKLLAAKGFDIHAQLKGVDVNFRCTLADHGTDAGIAYYRVPIPKLVYYRQLRAYYRVEVGLAHLPVSLHLDNEQTVEGELFDISAGGVCIRLRGGLPPFFKRGFQVPQCDIQLGESDTLSCKLELCYVSKPDNRGRIHVGARFIDMERAQERAVERYVAAIDRQLRRKIPLE